MDSKQKYNHLADCNLLEFGLLNIYVLLYVYMCYYVWYMYIMADIWNYIFFQNDFIFPYLGNLGHCNCRFVSDLVMRQANKFHQCMFYIWSFRHFHKLHCIPNRESMMKKLNTNFEHDEFEKKNLLKSLPGGFSMQFLDDISPLVIVNLVYAWVFVASVGSTQSDV